MAEQAAADVQDYIREGHSVVLCALVLVTSLALAGSSQHGGMG